MRRPLTPLRAAGSTIALGLVATAVLVAACDLAYPPTETDGLFGYDSRLMRAGAVGLAATLVATVVVARRPGHTGRPLRRAAILVGLAVVGLCVAVGAVGRWRHDRAVRQIVGTWVMSSGEVPLSEDTFHPDGTYESLPLAGPEDERVRRRGGYNVSPDGLSINLSNLPKQPRQLPDGTPIWDEYLTFNGPDEFRVWAMSRKNYGGYTYRRVR